MWSSHLVYMRLLLVSFQSCLQAFLRAESDSLLISEGVFFECKEKLAQSLDFPIIVLERRLKQIMGTLKKRIGPPKEDFKMNRRQAVM